MADDFPETGVELDLLGDPVRPLKDPRGRPSFARNKENQLLVISLRGAGYTQEEVAAYIRCDVKTLRKHFSRELDHGALFLDGLAVQVLVRKMLDGHVGAAKQIRELTQARAPGSKGDRKDKGDGKGDAPGKPAPLGKKDQQDRDAHQVPREWGDLLDGNGDPVH